MNSQNQRQNHNRLEGNPWIAMTAGLLLMLSVITMSRAPTASAATFDGTRAASAVDAAGSQANAVAPTSGGEMMFDLTYRGPAPSVVRVNPNAVVTSSWAAYTVWLNRSETYRLKIGSSVGTLLYWWPPLAVSFGLLAIIAGDVYDRGGCIKLVKPRFSTIYYPQNYWGGHCR